MDRNAVAAGAPQLFSAVTESKIWIFKVFVKKKLENLKFGLLRFLAFL